MRRNAHAYHCSRENISDKEMSPCPFWTRTVQCAVPFSYTELSPTQLGGNVNKGESDYMMLHSLYTRISFSPYLGQLYNVHEFFT